MSQSGNFYDGVVVAVLAVVFVAFLVGTASLLIPYGLPHTMDDVMATIMIGFVTSLITLPCASMGAIFVGVPVLLLLRHRGFTSYSAYLFGGVVISTVLLITIWLMHREIGFVPNDSDFKLAVVIVIIGGPVAATTVKCIGKIGAKSTPPGQ
jgi:hypothetical protein